MGGYSSTPRRAKTSEEGGDESLHYAASGMQGWRASMEDAHIALVRVPHSFAPSATAIGEARIRMHNTPQGGHPPRGASSGGDGSGGTITSGNPNDPHRGRSMTYSAGDAGHSDDRKRVPNEQAPDGAATHDGSSGGEGTHEESNKGFRDEEAWVGGDARGDEGEGADAASSMGPGWKAVDLLEDAAFFGVFDGHGGKAVAEFCRDRLPGLLAASPEIRAGNWKEGFPKVYHALDDLLVSGKGQEKSMGWGGGGRVDGMGMGSTIVTALLDRKRGQCYVAHAGDSRCVLCRAGRAVQLTRDHKPRIPSEYARIVAAGGHVSRAGRVNDNLNLSRAIGDVMYKKNRLREPKDQMISAEPDVCRFLVTPGVDEFLLLACDGVWEMMDTTRVVTFVRSALRAGSSPREVCESLLDACLSPDPRSTRYAGCDNMTVVLVLLEGWQSALATKAYTPALTFSGGRLAGIAEAAATLSATLPRLPRQSVNARPPLPPEFRLPKAVEAATATRSTTDSSRLAHEAAGSKDSKEGDKSETGEDTATATGTVSATKRSDGRPALIGWPQRRIAEGKVAPPRTAHGIEFSLAMFSPPAQQPAPPPAGPGANQAPLRGALVRSRSASHANLVATRNGRGRHGGQHRSSTAPMLPSPLMHLRRGPSEDRVAAAAALAVLGQVGAAGAVASAIAEDAATEDQATFAATGEQGDRQGQQPDRNTSTTAPQGSPVASTAAPNGDDFIRRQRSRSDGAGLVYVPAVEDIPPVEVTVTATGSSFPAV